MEKLRMNEYQDPWTNTPDFVEGISMSYTLSTRLTGSNLEARKGKLEAGRNRRI